MGNSVKDLVSECWGFANKKQFVSKIVMGVGCV